MHCIAIAMLHNIFNGQNWPDSLEKIVLFAED